MSTTPNFSNFISNFSGSSDIDIVSSVSDKIALAATKLSNNTTFTVYVRYFCIGDLLIQFSANTLILSNQSTGEYKVPFPYTYDSTPYTVMLTGTRPNDNNSVIPTLKSFDTSSFVCSISSNAGWINFVAIGPRPSALYTA